MDCNFFLNTHRINRDSSIFTQYLSHWIEMKVENFNLFFFFYKVDERQFSTKQEMKAL